MCAGAISLCICFLSILEDVFYIGLSLRDRKYSHPVADSSSRYCVFHSIRSLPGTSFNRSGATHFKKDKQHSLKTPVESLRVFMTSLFCYAEP